MCLSLVAATEKVDNLVDRVDEEDNDVAHQTRTPQGVVMLDDVTFAFVEQLADYTADNGCDDDVLIRGTLHARLYSELPPYGRNQRRVEHRAPEAETTRACRHEVGCSGIRVKYVVEDSVVMVNLRVFDEDVLVPARVESGVLIFLAVPRRTAYRGMHPKGRRC